MALNIEIIDAVIAGDLSRVKELLDRGIDINARDSMGRTLSHYAIGYNKPNVLEFLLSKNADIEAKDNIGRSLLFFAVNSVIANNTSLDLVKLLLERGANIEVEYSSNYTPLYYAVKSTGPYALVKELLDKGANPDAADDFDYRPLHYAAKEGRSDIAGLLLDKGADIEANTKRFSSPLSIAVLGKYVDLAKVLIDRGANISIDQNGSINLKVGDSTLSLDPDDSVKQQIVDFLKDRVSYTPLHYAAREGKLDLITRLLDKGNDINARDINGWTPLHYAAWNGQLGAARLLVGKSASISAKTTDTLETPLGVAGRYQKSQVEKFLKEKQSEYDRLLLAAVHRGDANQVTDLLNKGANIEAKGTKNETPLCVAASKGDLPILQLLVDRNADVNVQDSDGKTPLHHAAYTGQGIDLILGKGANIEAEDRNRCTPLHYAAWGGQLNAARFLVVKGANVNEACNADLRKPIHVAAMENHKGIIEFFISKGVNVDDTNKDGWTPLHYAAWQGKLDAARLLVDKNANISAKATDTSETPLGVAGRYQKSQVENFLSAKQSEYDNKLLTAVHRGDANQVTDLLNKGANIKAKGAKNETPLCVAASKGNLPIIQLLVDRNADVNVQDSDGKTPLHHAAYTGQGVDLILDKGANIEAKDKNGWTPLHYAAWGGQLGAARLLVDKNANISAKATDTSETPLGVAGRYQKSQVENFLSAKQSEYDNLLLTAVHNGDISKVTDLLNRGANVNARDGYAWTPLHYAAQGKKLDIVDLLLYKSADVNAKSYGDVTPLHCAAWAGDIHIIEKLFNKGAVQSLDKSGDTPLKIAMQRNWSKSVINYLWGRGGRVSYYDGVYYTWHYNARVYSSLRKYDLRRDRAPRTKREVYTFLAGQHTSLHDEVQSYLKNIAMTEPLLDGGGNIIGAESSDNDQMGYNKAKSKASKSSSWINVAAHAVVDTVMGVFQFISSPFKPAIDMGHSRPSNTIAIQNADTNGALLWLNVLVRKITGKKYISTAEQPIISLPEVECHASDIINGFEKVLKETAVKSGISVTKLNFDPIKPQSDIVGQLINGKFSEISKTLYSSAKQACPEFKQNKKFLSRLETRIEEFLDKKEKEFSSIGPKRKEAKQIRKRELCSSANFITDNPTTVSLANTSRSESQLPGKTDDKPRTCLNDPTVDNQLQRSL